MEFKVKTKPNEIKEKKNFKTRWHPIDFQNLTQT